MSLAPCSLASAAVRTLGALAFGASLATAQPIWRVDGVNFSDVASAYAVAQPGDVILVTLNDAQIGQLTGKGVRIVAGTSGLRLNGTNSHIGGIPSGEQLVLSG